MSEQLKVEIHPGTLPPFWDRNVIFFSNIHSVFYDNVEGSQELIRGIAGATGYGGRVLSILDLLYGRRPNLTLLETEPDESLSRYLTAELGLSLPDHALLDRETYLRFSGTGKGGRREKTEPFLESLRRHPAPWVDGFVTDSKLVNIASRLGKQTITTLEGSRNGNNKYLLYLHQRAQNLPTFDTLVVSDRAELSESLRKLRRMGYAKAVVKAQIGASGYGMVMLETGNSRTEKVPDHLFFEGACMVQGWLDADMEGVRKIGSPSVQLFLDEDSLYLFDLTEQVLDQEGVHEGNVCPPPYLDRNPQLRDELLRQARVAGEWLHEQGYRGTASTDFLVVKRGENTEAILCEINARVTGATYPAVLARYFNPEGAWYMRNIGFRKALEGTEVLSAMDRENVLYRKGAAKGIIPFNFNANSDGKIIKGQFLCLGENSNECSSLLIQAWSHLTVEWGYDRD